jgi:branched-chain amino acid transport system ATP-binding protein
MLLNVKAVSVFYEKLNALKEIHFEVDSEEVVTLVGANGAGKTTLLRTICGLEIPQKGEIYFQDRQIDGLKPFMIVRLGIAYVPEGRRLFPDMSVLENLRMGAYLRSGKASIRKDLEEIYLHFPGLKDRIRQQAGSLSGGEQQMVAIGRALMSRPKLLLLDEPSMGLSPLMVQEISKIVNSISKTGIGIGLVEQNVAMALKLANRAYVLEMGSIVIQGRASDLYEDDRVRRAYLGL